MQKHPQRIFLQAVNPKDFDESKKVAKQGRYVAKIAMKKLEAGTGKKVDTALNAKKGLGFDKKELKDKHVE